MLADRSCGVVKLLELIGRGGLSVTGASEICNEFVMDNGQILFPSPFATKV